MPFLGFILFLIFCLVIMVYTLIHSIRFIKTREMKHLRSLGLLWIVPGVLIGLVLYARFPITKERIIGTYKIDTHFYPGKNADWQHKHFFFEITKDDQFIFYEKLKDGNYKKDIGEVVWIRHSHPMLYKIVMDKPHPLIDAHPALYRGNRKFYYVFQSKFGNMFYRKVK